ncbi:MAG: hypothetical protein ACR2JY_04285 [Chloroflexota bacterium]
MATSALPAEDAAEYAALSEAERATLATWIAAALRPTQTVNQRYSSYGLKHVFEHTGSDGPMRDRTPGHNRMRDLPLVPAPAGFYVSNGAFKAAMLAAGYEPADYRATNWTFRFRWTLLRDIERAGEKDRPAHSVGTDQLLVGLMGCIARFEGREMVEAATVYADVLRTEAVRRACRLAVAAINGDLRLSADARAIVTEHIQRADAAWPDAAPLRIVLEDRPGEGSAA